MSSGTERVLALIRVETRGPGATLARAGLWMLSLVYAAVMSVYRLMYGVGLLRRVRLGSRVVSVGNITVGGTGKTTTIQYLANLLAARGQRVAVLSYGYRAADKDAVGLVSDGETVLMGASEAGDEAALLARTLPGVPILIGRRRVLSGAEAERLFQPDVLLCDDAFQYWRLYRDVDLVLVDAVEPWGYGHVLPRGLLREPRREAKRADAFLITHSDLVVPEALKALEAELAVFGRPVWTARHAPRAVLDLEGRTAAALEDLRGLKVLAVSSLGDPASFEATLGKVGAGVTPCRFPDHHRYDADEIAHVEDRACATGLRLITTAKDAVKLLGLARADMWWVLDIAMAIDGGDDFDSWIVDQTRRN